MLCRSDELMDGVIQHALSKKTGTQKNRRNTDVYHVPKYFIGTETENIQYTSSDTSVGNIMTEVSNQRTNIKVPNIPNNGISEVESSAKMEERDSGKTQRSDNVEKFTADVAGVCKKRPRHRRHDWTRKPSVSPTKAVRSKPLRPLKAENIARDGTPTVDEKRLISQVVDTSHFEKASADIDEDKLESQALCTTEKPKTELVSVADFHRPDKTENLNSETSAIVDQPKPPGSSKVKSYIQKFSSDIQSNKNEIHVHGIATDKKQDILKYYLETDIDASPKIAEKRYCLGPKPFKSQNSTGKCGPLYGTDEKNVIAQTIEQYKSVENKDKLVVKSKSETTFVESDHFKIDEQHVAIEAKGTNSTTANVLHSKLVSDSNKDSHSDGVEVAMSRSLKYHNRSAGMKDDLNTDHAALPETRTETNSFKGQDKNSGDSSVNKKDDENLTNIQCSQIFSQTSIKSRSSNETEINGETGDCEEKCQSESEVLVASELPELPQHFSTSDKLVGSSEASESSLLSGNAAYLNSFIRKIHGEPQKENVKPMTSGTVYSEEYLTENQGDFDKVNADFDIGRINADTTYIETLQNVEQAKSDIVTDFSNEENIISFSGILRPFQDVNNKLSNEEITCDSGPAVAEMFDYNHITSLPDDFDGFTLEAEWKPRGQIGTVSEAERNLKNLVNDSSDFSTAEMPQTPNPDDTAARPKELNTVRPGIRTNYRYPTRSHSGDEHGHQYASPIYDARNDKRPDDSSTQPGWKSDDSIGRRGSQSVCSGVSCDCSFHTNRAMPVSRNLSGHRMNRTSESNQSNLTGQSEGPVCRICQEGDDQEVLVSPCYCAGSLGLLHVSCLQKWLGASNKTNCEICSFEFMIERKPMPISHFIRDPGTVADRRNIICDLVCVSLISPLTMVTTYLCISGAMKYYVVESWERTGLLFLSAVLMGLYLVWLMVMLKHNYNLWRDWKMFHQEVTLLATPKITVGKKAHRAHSKDPTGSIRSRSTGVSTIDKVQLQSVKISVCGPIGRHNSPKDGFGSPRLSSGPGTSQQETDKIKSLPNLPPFYRSPSSKGSTKRSSHSPSSSQIPSSNPSRHQQTPSKCSVLSPVHESRQSSEIYRQDYDGQQRESKELCEYTRLGDTYPLQAARQNLRSDVRPKYLVKQENLEMKLPKDITDLAKSQYGHPQPSQSKYGRMRPINLESDSFSNLNAEMPQISKRDRRVLRSDREKPSDRMKRKSQSSYKSPLASQIKELIKKSPENSELSSIICIYTQTPKKENDHTFHVKKRQKMEKKSVAGHQQFTDAEIFSRGSSPVTLNAGIHSDKTKNPVHNDSSADTQPDRTRKPVHNDSSAGTQPDRTRKPVQNDSSIVIQPDRRGKPVHNDFNAGTEHDSTRQPVHNDSSTVTQEGETSSQ